MNYYFDLKFEQKKIQLKLIVKFYHQNQLKIEIKNYRNNDYSKSVQK